MPGIRLRQVLTSGVSPAFGPQEDSVAPGRLDPEGLWWVRPHSPAGPAPIRMWWVSHISLGHLRGKSKEDKAASRTQGHVASQHHSRCLQGKTKEHTAASRTRGHVPYQHHSSCIPAACLHLSPAPTSPPPGKPSHLLLPRSLFPKSFIDPASVYTPKKQ